jgi:hypothetical protein
MAGTLRKRRAFKKGFLVFLFLGFQNVKIKKVLAKMGVLTLSSQGLSKTPPTCSPTSNTLWLHQNTPMNSTRAHCPTQTRTSH